MSYRYFKNYRIMKRYLRNSTRAPRENYTSISDRSLVRHFRKTQKRLKKEEATFTFIHLRDTSSTFRPSSFLSSLSRAFVPPIRQLLIYLAGKEATSTWGSLGRGGGKGGVDITQILISTVEINARFWSLINARDSVQRSALAVLCIRTDGLGRVLKILPLLLSSFLPSFSFFSRSFLLACLDVRRPKITVCACARTYLALPVLISHEVNVRSTRPIRERGGHLGRWSRDDAEEEDRGREEGSRE